MPFFRDAASAVQALHIYGALGIGAFAWAHCRLIGWEVDLEILLWVCGALVIYNVDRLLGDEADGVNVPERAASSRRFRMLSVCVAVAATVALLGLPMVLREWWTLAAVVGGAVVCLSYSIPIFGFRLKDVPLLKSLFAPTVLIATIFGLPWWRREVSFDHAHAIVAIGRAWALLFFNMLLCDLRDTAGDRQCGVRSIPVVIGPRATWWMLAVLLIAIEALALGGAATSPREWWRTWVLMAALAPVYLGALLVAARRPQAESFYAWWVEGMLFLPALAVVFGR